MIPYELLEKESWVKSLSGAPFLQPGHWLAVFNRLRLKRFLLNKL